MAISIGLIIRQVAESKGLTQEALGRLINLHEKTVANIYKRVTCDTGLLLTLSDKLQHDFFQYYYQEDPLKSIQKGKLEELEAAVENLATIISQRDIYIKKIEETVSDKTNIIELLKEKIRFLENSSLSLSHNSQTENISGKKSSKRKGET